VGPEPWNLVEMRTSEKGVRTGITTMNLITFFFFRFFAGETNGGLTPMQNPFEINRLLASKSTHHSINR